MMNNSFTNSIVTMDSKGNLVSSMIGGKTTKGGKTTTKFTDGGMEITSTTPNYFRTEYITDNHGRKIDFSSFEEEIFKVCVKDDKVTINDVYVL